MANIVCKRCGITGDSKCPFCRNVRTDHVEIVDGKEVHIGGMDSIMSYRFTITDEEIRIKVYRDESPESVFVDLWHLLKEVGDDRLIRMLACRHEWDFAAGQVSDISCGHRSKLMSDQQFDEMAVSLLDLTGTTAEAFEMGLISREEMDLFINTEKVKNA